MARSFPRGDRVHLRPLRPSDRDAFLKAVRRSRRLHRPWAFPPATAEDYAHYTRRDTSRRALGVIRNDGGALAGVLNLSQIFHGAFRNAYLGYYAFTPHAGKGYLREGMELLKGYAFDDLGLHRLQANVQPGNARSIALLRASGFRLEGVSPRYLRIDGEWRDHENWVLLADDPTAGPVSASGAVSLEPVSSLNWRDVVRVKARRSQQRWVADVTRYLAMCRYDGVWVPLAVRTRDEVVGFLMWAHDPDDLGSYWLGGVMIDKKHQGRGYGRDALRAAIGYLSTMPGCRVVALSYLQDNEVAAALYASLGFVETGEMEHDEVVARLPVRRPRRRS
jgi:ribosomal-protein-alanine N-acetyltransferase